MGDKLLTPQNLHEYQKECVLHMLYHDEAMLWLGMGLGKEQPVSEPVLTPHGWVPIGEIKPGDYVIGADGKPTEVLRTFPQGIKEVFKVTFSDGSWTRCGIDHLWNVRTGKDASLGKPWRTMTVRQLLEAGLNSGKNSKWVIPMTGSVEYVPVELPIDPYTLGVLLGDGTVAEYGVTVCTDTDVIEKLNCAGVKPHETSPYTSYGYLPGLKQTLRDLNLMGKRSWEKHIPEIYLRASPDDRLKLLNGLMDTDGSPITCGGGLEYSTTSEQLADGVVELTQSLGGVARKSGPRVTKHQNGYGRPSWRVNVKLPPHLTPFTLERKLDGWIRPVKYLPQRRIRSIESIRFEESVCISVMNSDNLYLTRNHIVTHNTPITLTTIVDRIRAGQVQKVLVFGPLRVIQAVWAREAKKWEHTQHLRFSVVHGTKEKRTRALFANADIFLINYENMNWLAETLDHYYLSQDKPLPFQMVVYDEVSKLKNSTSLRMAGGKRDRKDRRGQVHAIRVTGWRKILAHFKYRIGLTGTPASNGYMDLHGQYLAVDGGKRLGEYVTHYKDSYFKSDYMGWNYVPTELGKQWIEYQISDITKKMDAKDYLDLPSVSISNLLVDMPASARKAYEEVEADMFTQLENGTEVEVFSRASVSNKCLQFCNGSPYYGESREFQALHDAKLEALEDVLEEAAGSPVLCSYTFKSDAVRIMKKFKKYRPVNLTETKSADTEKIINKWNNGEIKLLIGHPACLHPRTEVLTERRGWVKIVDVDVSDRVFDGVEFVNHDGCSYSGYKEVTDVFGVTMTPDHKLLIDGEWKEAKNVDDSEDTRRKALYQYQGDDQSIGEMLTVRRSIGNGQTECCKTQPSRSEVLSTLCSRSVPQHDGHSYLADMVRNEEPCKRYEGSKLRRSRDWNVRKVARVCEFLRRHERRLSGSLNNRTSECQQRILERELPVGNQHGATIQQAKQPVRDLPWGENTSRGTCPSIRVQQNHVTQSVESRYDRGSSCGRCTKIELREGYEACKCQTKTKAHVYDLVNCGPRHRFVIRNEDGDVFVSHNSMGHGVDGLQQNGHILVWFGLNWSLELYEQMNGRINRQGQKHPVQIIRIMCRDSIDLAVADALERKTDDQEGLKAALQRYRDGVTTNDLSVNFF